MVGNRPPLVFIHGLWLHSTTWQPWIELFDRWGFESHAPAWPGEPATVEEARQRPEASAEVGLNDVTDHYARIVRSLNDPPVVIGHCLGGLIAQKLVCANLARAAVAIAPTQMTGTLLRRCSKLWQRLPTPESPSQAVSLSAEQFRFAFANSITPEEASALFGCHAVPSPGRLLLELAIANSAGDTRTAVDTSNSRRGPLLLISGQEDRLVPDVVTRATYKLYGDSAAVTDLKQFADRAHCLTIDSGWRTVADYAAAWLGRQDLSAGGPRLS
jgi:non-heme chloroperoxidase